MVKKTRLVCNLCQYSPLSNLIHQSALTLIRVQSREQLHILSEIFCPRPFLTMKFTVETYYLISIVNTLAIVTTSFPQSPSGPRNAILGRRKRLLSPQWVEPTGCLELVLYYHRYLKHKLVIRGSQSPETHVAA